MDLGNSSFWTGLAGAGANFIGSGLNFGLGLSTLRYQRELQREI